MEIGWPVRSCSAIRYCAVTWQPAHEVALERKPFLYEQALRWLDEGGERKRPKSNDATASR